LAALPAHSEVWAGFTPSSFRVNESGAATYTIPIRVPSGTAGMEPQLALVYNSQAGNGLLGTGWSLSGLSFISRCGRTLAQDGVIAGVTYDSNDRYCIDGQRLVMVKPPSGVYGADGVEYRTERESFTRIVSYGAAGNGPAYFKAWTKAGQIIEYGNTENSRIEAQGKTTVRVYAVNKISDTKGNFLTVTYNEDNLNGDFYPTEIDYTLHPSTGASFPNKVLFQYETRTDVTPVYVGGSVIKTQNRLKSIQTLQNSAGTLQYVLGYTYAPNNGPSLLTSITEAFLYAVSGQGLLSIPPLSMTWQTNTGNGSLAAPVAWGMPISPMTAAVLGDVDGDGLADMVYVSANYGPPTIVVQLSNGSGFGNPVPVGLGDYRVDPDSGQTLISPILMADVDGDGRADVITATGSGAGNVRLSTSAIGQAGLAAPTSWGAPILPYAQPVFGDVNGDGLADMVYTSGVTGYPTIFARLSNGSGFGDPVNLGSADATTDPDSGGYSAVSPIAIGDVNADGRADVVTVSEPTNIASGSTGQGNVRLSQGNTLAAPVFWGSPLFNSSIPVLADVNGDGFADLVYITVSGTPSASVIVHISNGAGFAQGAILGSADTWQQAAQDPDTGNPITIQRASAVAIADVNGDGSADVVTVETNAGSGAGNGHISQTPIPNLITTFADSLGASIDVTYASLSDSTVYTRGTGAADPARDVQPQIPLRVVAAINQSDGIAGKFKTSYSYASARVHRKGGGFLGFATVTATSSPEPQKTITTTKTFGQDYPFQGLLTQVQSSAGSGGTTVTNTWGRLVFPNPPGQYHRCDLTSSEQTTTDLDGTALPTVKTTTSYDDYGNAKDIVILTKNGNAPDGYSKTIHNDYINDDPNWILGRLRRSQVTSEVPLSSLPQP
jgi:hypothetical protein